MIAPTNVVDTNVIRVANRQHDQVSSQCIADCTEALSAIKKEARIAIDDSFIIIREYQKKELTGKPKRAGDAFVKWVLQHRKTDRCDCVRLEADETRGFNSFPEHKSLADFDYDDRVFVAVSAAHPESPPILQAADTKWLHWAPALGQCGVEVRFLCDSDIRKFRKANPGGK